MLDVGLYVHVPFCSTKCGYCDFFSRPPTAGETARLVDALLAELAAGPVGTVPRMRVGTVFVGGGTPTVLPAEHFSRLLGELGRLARRDDASEFTVEANPASLDEKKAVILNEAGVSRVSLGVQSFHEAELRTLGRRHHPNDVDDTIELLRSQMLCNFSFDLIYGIPGQTPSSWCETLRMAVAFGPNHLACYGLTYPPETPLAERLREGAVDACDEEAEVRMYESAIRVLSDAGYEHYEISNFARPNHRCQHNLVYWRNGPYIGVGPAAAAYIDGERTRNVANVERYIEATLGGRSPIVERERLDRRARAGETAMLQLRLTEGIDRARFQRFTGFDPMDLFGDVIRAHAAERRVSVTPSHIGLTSSGLLIADSIMADFLSAARQGG